MVVWLVVTECFFENRKFLLEEPEFSSKSQEILLCRKFIFPFHEPLLLSYNILIDIRNPKVVHKYNNFYIQSDNKQPSNKNSVHESSITRGVLLIKALSIRAV